MDSTILNVSSGEAAPGLRVRPQNPAVTAVTATPVLSRRTARRQRALTRLYDRAAVELSDHACQRAVERGVSEDDVLLTVAAPEQTYCCRSDVHGPDRRLYRRADVAVVVDERLRQVVTVLPRTGHDVPGRPRTATASGAA